MITFFNSLKQALQTVDPQVQLTTEEDGQYIRAKLSTPSAEAPMQTIGAQFGLEWDGFDEAGHACWVAN